MVKIEQKVLAPCQCRNALKKPCSTRLSEGKSVTSVVSPGTYAPVLRSAYGELLKHSAVSSKPVFLQLGTACHIVYNAWSAFS